APDLAGRRDFELLHGGDFALDGTRDMDVLSLNRGDHAAGLTDDQVAQNFDIALHRAINANIAIGLERANKAGAPPADRLRLAVESRRWPALRFLGVTEHRSSYGAPALEHWLSRVPGVAPRPTQRSFDPVVELPRRHYKVASLLRQIKIAQSSAKTAF